MEYARNKLFVTGSLDGADMYLVENWSNVSIIIDPYSENVAKTQAKLLPGFDVETFPFIAVTGKEHLIILNLKTRTHKPLIEH